MIDSILGTQPHVRQNFRKNDIIDYMKSIVVAYDQKRGIGADNDLLWKRDLPADLRHFRDITAGGTVIMGRKTYDSIGRPLPNRQNIVVSRSNLSIEGVVVVGTLEEAFALSERDIHVIGGGSIYEQALDSIDVVYATEVDATFPQATVFFSALPIDIWVETAREHHDADDENKYAYDFVTYQRC